MEVAQTQRQTAVVALPASLLDLWMVFHLDQTDRHTHPLTPTCLLELLLHSLPLLPPSAHSLASGRLTPVPSNSATSPLPVPKDCDRLILGLLGPSRNTLPLLSESLPLASPQLPSHLPNLLCRPLPHACPLTVNGPGLSTSSLNITPMASVTICTPRAPNL